MRNSSLLLLGAVGVGGYFLLTNKKSDKSSNTGIVPPNKEPPKQGQEGWWFLNYDCKSIEIINRPAFNKQVSKIIDEILTQEKITPQNLFKLNPISLAKKAIGKFSQTCADRNPKLMSFNEKIIFLFISVSIISEFRRVITIDYDPNVGYQELITEDCPPMEAPIDHSKCKYVWDATSPTYKEWLKVLKSYKEQIITYLGLENNQKEVTDAWSKIKSTNKFP